MNIITIIQHSIGYFQLQKVKIKGPKLIKYKLESVKLGNILILLGQIFGATSTQTGW